MSILLSNASLLGLQTTSWQTGGAVRTILEVVSTIMAQEDVIVSIMAQGGFLDYAASGTVSYIALNGLTVVQPVTPDPSIPSQNPTGVLGWLDVLASSVYNVQRIPATFAANTIAIANSTASTYGPFTAGTYHIANAVSGNGYSNSASLTITPAAIAGGTITSATNGSPITITTASAHGLSNASIVNVAGVLGNVAANGFFGVTVLDGSHFTLSGSTGSGVYTSGGTVNVCTTAPFQADLIGPQSSASPNTITRTTTALVGVSVDNLLPFVGQNFEANAALAARCRLKLQSLSPNGAAGAFRFFALSASQLLAAQTPPVTLAGGAITRASSSADPTSGVVITTVANAAGPVSGVSNLAVTGATNASPIVITTASAHGLSSGAFVTISGVLGTTAANNTWVVTFVSGTQFSLNGSVGNAAYVSGGIVEGGDLGQVDLIIQQNCVPVGTIAQTQSAVAFNVTITGNVFVPFAQVAVFQAAVNAALPVYFATLPIGGIGAGMLDFESIVGVIYESGSIGGQPSYVVSMNSVLVNGVAADAAYPTSTSVATLTSAVISVSGV
jgi:hypothetical protein